MLTPCHASLTALHRFLSILPHSTVHAWLHLHAHTHACGAQAAWPKPQLHCSVNHMILPPALYHLTLKIHYVPWFCCPCYCCCGNIIISCGLVWSIYPYNSSGLLYWHWGNHMIAPVPVKQPWRIWIQLTGRSHNSMWPVLMLKLGYTVYNIFIKIFLNDKNTRILFIILYQ